MNAKKSDVYNVNCPSHKVLDLIGNKWVILIIEKLAMQTHRFGELKKAMNGVSPKVLTQLLKILEENNLITRHSYPILPLKVEYSLSPLGKSLSVVCHHITTWSAAHFQEMLADKKA